MTEERMQMSERLWKNMGSLVPVEGRAVTEVDGKRSVDQVSDFDPGHLLEVSRLLVLFGTVTVKGNATHLQTIY